jgi:hypothetical protein
LLGSCWQRRRRRRHNSRNWGKWRPRRLLWHNPACGSSSVRMPAEGLRRPEAISCWGNAWLRTAFARGYWRCFDRLSMTRFLIPPRCAAAYSMAAKPIPAFRGRDAQGAMGANARPTVAGGRCSFVARWPLATAGLSG